MSKKTPWHVIAIHHPMGMQYAGGLKEESNGSLSLSMVGSKQQAHYYQSAGSAVRDAKRIAEGLRYQTSIVPLDAPRKKSTKRNPAPGPAERSEKFHRLRAKLLTQLQIAKRRDNFPLEQNLSRKLLKLDSMFYAPRNIKRRK